MYYNPLFLQTPSVQEDVFYATDLGRLHRSIPFKEIALKIPSPPYINSGRGRKPFLKVEGGLALLVLKHYTGLSDEMLIDRLNTDWCMQYFCGLRLGLRRIKDRNLVSWWRCYISRHLNIQQLQEALIGNWHPYMQQTHMLMMDATVYESNIRYPTDAKLLWESIVKVYALLLKKRKNLKLRSSRSNYQKHKRNYLNYQKSRKKSRRKDRKLRKQLLKYLGRLLQGIDHLQKQHAFNYSNKETRLLKNIQTVFEQQQELLYGSQEVKHRIVSLHKPQVRPIIRGKEIKPVEFGAKVHKVQVDGLSFIEYLSYENFNEGTRLKQSVAFHQKHFGKCSQLAADAIYATNENRRYCTSMDIATSFKAKGRQGKMEDQKSTMRSALSTARSTVLEGSFGNEKKHYLLDKVRAKTEATEITWIFFGMMTANASIISKRVASSEQLRRSA
jgi:IS5 family transposase